VVVFDIVLDTFGHGSRSDILVAECRFGRCVYCSLLKRSCRSIGASSSNRRGNLLLHAESRWKNLGFHLLGSFWGGMLIISGVGGVVVVVWCGVMILCVNIFGGGETRSSCDKLLGCSFGGILLFEGGIRVSASTEILVMVYTLVVTIFGVPVLVNNRFDTTVSSFTVSVSIFHVAIFVVTTVDGLDSRV